MARPPIDGGRILITGASSGIGRELARVLAQRASTLILAARRRDRLEALAEELKALRPDLAVSVEPCDLSDLADAGRLADRVIASHGGLDVLVNNAGLGDVGLFELAPWPKLEAMLRVNVEAPTLLVHRFLPGMLERGKGGVLNVSSGFGLNIMPGVATYVGTKHYLTSFSECLRLELVGTGVVVTQLCPGPVPTEFEQVAGNPVGRPMPALLQTSPERCARAAVEAFSRGQALVIPGALMNVLTTLGAVAPRPVLRLAYRWMGGALRKRQRALLESGAPS